MAAESSSALCDWPISGEEYAGPRTVCSEDTLLQVHTSCLISVVTVVSDVEEKCVSAQLSSRINVQYSGIFESFHANIFNRAIRNNWSLTLHNATFGTNACCIFLSFLSSLLYRLQIHTTYDRCTLQPPIPLLNTAVRMYVLLNAQLPHALSHGLPAWHGDWMVSTTLHYEYLSICQSVCYDSLHAGLLQPLRLSVFVT